MTQYREHVKGSGKDKKGNRYIIIEAKNASIAKARLRKITLDSDVGSIFRTVPGKVTKHKDEQYKVFYDSKYVGTKYKRR